jgi:DNA-binding NarL/FixJ family response regulator
MSAASPKTLLLSQDAGLLSHWRLALGRTALALAQFDALPGALQPGTMVWIDHSLPQLPAWSDPRWKRLLQAAPEPRIVYASSNPHNAQGMAALDAGCAAYCHAFADAKTLRQVRDVVASGQVWIGRELMQQLLSRTQTALARAPQVADTGWADGLTQRERQVAVLAANGASNQAIATDCGISERTVKAHLTAVFEKLNLTDRLQLALRVHGIH